MDNTTPQTQNQQQTPQPVQQTTPVQQGSIFANKKLLLITAAVFILLVSVVMGVLFAFTDQNRSAVTRSGSGNEAIGDGGLANGTQTPEEEEARLSSAPTFTPTPTITKAPTPTLLPGEVNNNVRKNQLGLYKAALLSYRETRGMYPQQLGIVIKPIAKDGYDICKELIPRYMIGLPKDPLTEDNPKAPKGMVTDCAANYVTGYTIQLDADDTVTIRSSFAQEGETILVRFNQNPFKITPLPTDF
jgi:hypothetical protein